IQTATSLDPEKVAYWFCRLNGCFTVTNLVVHPDVPDSERTDVDVLAVRFPDHGELVHTGQPITDHKFFSEMKKINLLIVEVKSGRCEVNDTLTAAGVIEYILAFAGMFSQENVSAVANAVRSDGYFEDATIAVRLLVVC